MCATSAGRIRPSTARCASSCVACSRSSARWWRTMASTTSAVDAAPVTRPPAIGWARLPVGIRRGLIAAALIVIWHFYALHKGPLLIATPWQTAEAFWDGWREGTLAQTTWTTLQLLLEGVAIGAGIAAILTAFATLSKVGEIGRA